MLDICPSSCEHSKMQLLWQKYPYNQKYYNYIKNKILFFKSKNEMTRSKRFTTTSQRNFLQLFEFLSHLPPLTLDMSFEVIKKNKVNIAHLCLEITYWLRLAIFFFRYFLALSEDLNDVVLYLRYPNTIYIYEKL